MSAENAFHLTSSAAEAYETQKMPAIFIPLARATLDAVPLPTSADVLDVACGTGAMAREISGRLTGPSRIAGSDLNPAMIEIARRKFRDGAHVFEFVVAPADDMPFAEASFDLIFCQQGLQYFADKPAALAEMRRVAMTGATLCLSCWAAVPPFFQIVADALRRHIGASAAEKAVEPFSWTDGGLIRSLIQDAGFDCPMPRGLSVARVMAASAGAIRAELLATPNEAALRGSGESCIDAIVGEVLLRVEPYRKGDRLVMPQTAHLFVATAT